MNGGFFTSFHLRIGHMVINGRNFNSPSGEFELLGSSDFLVSLGSSDSLLRICMRDGSSRQLLDTNKAADGRDVAAAGDDGMLSIWDSRSGQLLGRWRHTRSGSMACGVHIEWEVAKWGKQHD